MKNFNNQGQSLIGIVIVLVVVGLMGGGLYFYLSKQIPEIPKISEKPAQERVVTPPDEEKLPTEEKPNRAPEEKITPTPEITCQDECSQTGFKKCSDNSYQICGNYDADNCLEWSSVTNCPVNSICQNGNCIQQKCTDGTLYGQCSTNKPKYCDNGKLVDNSTKCGSLSSNKVCSTRTTASDLGIIDITTCTLQTDKWMSVGIVEFAPQNVVYGSVSYANLKSLSGCPSSCSKTGYFWVNGRNVLNQCHDIVNQYSFPGLFNNPASSISKSVECRTYDISQKGVETLHSVYYIKDWWEKEATKYGITGFSMDIDVKGPYTLTTDPPAGGRWGSEGTCNANIKQFFENEGAKHGINNDSYDIIIYVYLNDWRLSGRAYHGFTSCADMSGLKVFASVPTDTYPSEADSIVMLTHEIGHILGANDYYTSPCYLNSQFSRCVKDPEGIPEPNKIPKYPQTKSCIMAQSIQRSNPSSSSMPPTQALLTPDLAVLCDAAAKEIGWK